MIQLEGVLQQQASGFNPQTAIGWHSFFWTQGTATTALGYTDTAAVGTFSNETGEKDLTNASNKPVWKTSNSTFNNKPTVDFPNTADTLDTGDFNSTPTAPISIVSIMKITAGNWKQIWNGTGAQRCLLSCNSNGTQYYLWAGGSVRLGGTPDSNPHLFVAYHDGSTGNDTLAVDGTGVINADAGSNTQQRLVLNVSAGMSVAMIAIYVGDITAHAQWSAFKTWAASHYSLTIA